MLRMIGSEYPLGKKIIEGPCDTYDMSIPHLDGVVNKTAHGDPSITQPFGDIASLGVGRASCVC